MEESKITTTPGTNDEGRSSDDCNQPLDSFQETMYSALVPRAHYLSPDRPDISYAVNEFAKSMAAPKRGDWCRFKRLTRYLLGRPRLQFIYKWQSRQHELIAHSGADWTGDRESRRSTSGGLVTIGEHSIEEWSKTQSLIALSSGESEIYATLKAASEALGGHSHGQRFWIQITREELGRRTSSARNHP